MNAPVKLLVGLDFGPTIEATLETASLLATRLGGELVLSHAVEYVPHNYGTGFAEEREVLRHINEHLAQRCESLATDGLSVTAMPARVGSPHKVLLQDAEEAGATALVIGVTNRSAIKRFFLGSSAEKLVRSSPRPVFLRHPDDQEDDFRSVLCAVDFSEHAERTLANAANFARRSGAQLHVLHVEQPAVVYPGIPHIPVYSYPAPSLADHQAELDAFVARVNTSGLQVTTHLATGDPGAEIVSTAMELQPGLLVLGKHGHGGIVDRILGGVATHILRNVPCSSLVIGDRDL
jgi:universal stress protein E